MDDEAAVGGRDGLGAGGDEPQAVRDRRAALAAVTRDRLAVDELQHEEGLAVGRRAAVEQASDVRMIEPREDLPLAQEAPPDPLGVETGLQKLQRHALLELPVAALGDPDLSHAAAPEKRHEDVGTDSLASLGRARILDPRRVRGHASLEETAGVRVGGEEVSHENREIGVGDAERVQASRGLGGRQLGQLAEDLGRFAQTSVRGTVQPLGSRSRQVSVEIRARGPPLPAHRPVGNLERARDLFLRETREETPLDDPRELRGGGLEALQGFVEGEEHLGALAAGRRHLDAFERQGRLSRAALFAHPVPRVIEQDHAHRPRRRGVEVAPVPNRPCRAARELEVGLVDEARRVQRPVEARRADLPMREPAELAVNRLEEPIECLRIPGLGGPQQGGDFPRFDVLGRTSRVIGHRNGAEAYRRCNSFTRIGFRAGVRFFRRSVVR